MNDRRTLFSGSDIYCQVSAEMSETGLFGDERVKALDPHPPKVNICIKGPHAPASLGHPNRVLCPLKLFGTPGSSTWQSVRWEEVTDDIPAWQRVIVGRKDSVALVAPSSQQNSQTDSSAGRHFMNSMGACPTGFTAWLPVPAKQPRSTASCTSLVPLSQLPQHRLRCPLRSQPEAAPLDPNVNAIYRAQGVCGYARRRHPRTAWAVATRVASERWYVVQGMGIC